MTAAPEIHERWHLLNAVPDGIVIVDGSGTILYANEQVTELLGWERDQLVGSPIELLVPGERGDAHRRHRKDYSLTPRNRPMGSGMHLVAQCADGSTLPVEVSLAPARVESTNVFVAALRDVSDRREIEARLRDAERRSTLADDRERIARDLHDTVIQDVYGTALSLQSIAGRAPEDLAARITEVALRQDHIIRQLRVAVFGLTTPVNREMSAQVLTLAVIDESTPALGFRPGVHFHGPIDTVTGLAVQEHLIPTLREALSNVARHADASRVDVDLEYTNGRLVLRVTDDGVGIAPSDERPSGNGLGNLAYRAATLGGELIIGATNRGGTMLEWSVPVT